MSSKGLKPDLLRGRLHTDAKDLTKNIDRDIPLYSADRPRWHMHPNYAKSLIDIAVIELEQKTFTAGVYLKALGSSNFLPERFLINPGDDVMVIGFPRGLSDSKHNLPLVRNALVSSAYGIDFEAVPMFLLTFPLYDPSYHSCGPGPKVP